MAEFTFGQMLDQAGQAAAESGATSDVVVAAGTHVGTIVFTNSKRSSRGKLTVGAKFRVDSEGPSKGGGVWMNQYLSPESPAALDIWFRTFETLGVPRTHWASFGADLDAAGADVATRIKGVQAQITVEIDGQYGPRIKSVRPVGQGAAAPGVPGPTTPSTVPAAGAATRPRPAF